MRRQALHALLLAALALACSVLYGWWASSRINAPLGLDHFDEALVRAKVQATAQRLLDDTGNFELRLSQKTDSDTLRRMQALVGLQAAGYWARKEIPIHRWVYRVYPPQKLTSWNVFREVEPPLTAEVDSSGQILALKIPPKKGAAPTKLTSEQALQTAQDALRFVGADVGLLTLTSTTQGDSEGQQTFDFVWKQPVNGFPGLLHQYSVTLRSGFLTNLRHEVLFADEAPGDPWQNLVFPLLWGASWFFLGLVLFLLFIQKLRRDEVDFAHAQKVGLLAGALTFVRFVSNPQGSVLVTLLGAAVVSLLAALFFSFLWAVAESLLRQAFPEKLRFVDLIFQGHWRVREMGRHLMWSAGVGLLFLLVPLLILLVAGEWRGLGFTMLPVEFQLGNLHFPGGLVGNALLGPLPYAAILGTVFLGAVYPLLRLRFSLGKAAAFFAVLFGFAVAQVLPVGPPFLALVLGLAAGVVLFGAMERGGFLSGLLILYAPLAARNIALLISARYTPVWLQGWLSLGMALLILAGALLVALAGRSKDSMEGYEPEYLLRMRERERFARELEIAKGIQERFLPKQTPQIPGFSLATRCLPAMEVGGDYYDFLPLPDGRWLLLLGDVSGKGVRAAFYMTLTKGILHSISAIEGDHLQILKRLNRIFGNLTESGIFLTLCAVVLDPATREVRLISAGHNPPFLVRREGIQVLEPKGLVLGVMNDEVFLKSLRDIHLTLASGETLVLYTDGVTEAMNRESEEFGMERLRAALDRARSASASGVIDTVLAAVERFEAGAHAGDDLTMLVLQAHET